MFRAGPCRYLGMYERMEGIFPVVEGLGWAGKPLYKPLFNNLLDPI